MGTLVFVNSNFITYVSFNWRVASIEYLSFPFLVEVHLSLPTSVRVFETRALVNRVPINIQWKVRQWLKCFGQSFFQRFPYCSSWICTFRRHILKRWPQKSEYFVLISNESLARKILNVIWNLRGFSQEKNSWSQISRCSDQIRGYFEVVCLCIWTNQSKLEVRNNFNSK